MCRPTQKLQNRQMSFCALYVKRTAYQKANCNVMITFDHHIARTGAFVLQKEYVSVVHVK